MQERRSVTTLTGDGDVPATERTGPRPWLRIGVALGVAAVVVALDQLTKTLAVDHLADRTVHVVGTLDLTLERNTGFAFSLFPGHSAVLIVVAVVLLAALVALVRRAPTYGRAAVLGLIIGGALGNLADRLFRGDGGAVVDFIELHFWPTFNVADSCIVVGAVLLVVSLLRTEHGERVAPAETNVAPGAEDADSPTAEAGPPPGEPPP